MNHFFDIGANVGQTFDWFLSKTDKYDGWKIFCFEPSPRHLCGLLDKAVEFEDRYEVAILPFAVSGSSNLHVLYEKQDGMGDSLHEKTYVNGLVENQDTGRVIIVCCKAISEIINSLTKPDDRIVIKLDAEGSEVDILEDLLASEAIQRVDEILIEWHLLEGDKKQQELHHASITQRLKEKGVKVSRWQF